MEPNFLPKNNPHHSVGAPVFVGVPPYNRPKVSLKVPTLLVVPFLLAASVGAAHHFFYSFLDGKTAVNQAVRMRNPAIILGLVGSLYVLNNEQWILRAGTAIAYLAKLLFAAAIGTAFTQLLWTSLRSEFFSLGAIDDLFDLRNSPWRLFNSEVLSNGKLAVLLVALIW